MPERRARYWTDVALAFSQWGKTGEAYRALLSAERAAPDEVRAQPKVRALTADLLHAPTSPMLSGLRDLAARVGAA